MIGVNEKRQVHLRLSQEEYNLLQEMYREKVIQLGRMISKAQFIREKLFASAAISGAFVESV
jgi:hypothetical protein|tara:strand:+ start:857 stop:1042 length:186 start_codon:yes stop_codon:yes gene_type:complete